MAKDFSRAYGTALYALAVEEKCADKVFEDFAGVNRIMESSPEFLRLLSNPRLGESERAGVIENVFGGKTEKILLNALKLLAEKRRCGCVPKCFEVYKRLYCEDNGILPVKAYAAVELSDAQKSRLVEKLEKKTGKRILLDTKTDPGYIGGIMLEYGGKRYDASVKGRLENLSRAIRSSE